MLATSLPRALAIVVLAALASGACGPKGLEVRVTALRDPARTGRTYWLVPADGLDATKLELTPSRVRARRTVVASPVR